MIKDIVKSLGHPEEILNLLKFKMGGCRAVMAKLDYVSSLPICAIDFPYTPIKHVVALFHKQAYRIT